MDQSVGKNSTKPFQSRLQPYKTKIIEMWFKRHTLKDIRQWLNDEHNINITVDGLSKFIKRWKNRVDPHDRPDKKKATKKDKAAKTIDKNSDEFWNQLDKVAKDDPGKRLLGKKK